VTPSKVEINTLHLPLLNRTGVDVAVMRLDKLSPIMSGNKLFKLHQNIEFARDNHFSPIISFGGAYSNHIHALAMAGQYYGIDTVGIIRGDQPKKMSDTLQDALACGMQLEFVSRADYRSKNDDDYLESLSKRWPAGHIIPEGGSNTLGVNGCQSIVTLLASEIGNSYDAVALACGTGSTLAGIALAVPENKQVFGFPVLKGGDFLKEDVQQHLLKIDAAPRSNWQLVNGYDFGGYANVTDELVTFMTDMFESNALPLDGVYTAKALYGLLDQIEQSHFDSGQRVIFIHTGGLQGNRGFFERYPEINFNQPEAAV